MTKEKNINANAVKDKFADELLSDEQLDKIAGGSGSADDYVINARSSGTSAKNNSLKNFWE